MSQQIEQTTDNNNSTSLQEKIKYEEELEELCKRYGIVYVKRTIAELERR